MLGDLQTLQLVTAGAVLVLVVCVGVILSQKSRLRSATEQLGEQAELRERLARLDARAERLPVVESELADLRIRHEQEVRDRVAREEELKGLRENHAARLEEIAAMKRELEERFANLAGNALKGNSEAFLGLVTERFKKHSVEATGDLETRKAAIEGLVKPLTEKLGVFDKRIEEIEKARNDAYGAIRTQVRELSDRHRELGQETRRLVQALRAPKTRGRWGEMQLRQVFEMAGMAQHVDYLLESTVATDEGARRPDAIVSIPGGKSIVVDAKTPLEAYLDALECDSPEKQQEQIVRHAQQVRQHVKMLASKAYQEAIPTTPDFVVMFIPGETFVSAAAEVDPHLIEYAFENKVLIATPTTLMALVKAIAYGWQQEKMAENAADVQRLAKELYDRLGTFASHLGKVGKTLGQSVDNYNKAVGSLEGRVLPSARKFESMGVVPANAQIESPASVDHEPRRLAASEFTDQLAEETPS